MHIRWGIPLYEIEALIKRAALYGECLMERGHLLEVKIMK